ncbi:DJ-1/PfpI family protein [Aliarcobacter butzleri]|uniref:DJ-1/PfpI family protein n=1 Tax=Aliarcobacter butzleri TaxID=28197 RepID=UPI0021B33D61|nr:DJ-1/PfpI family protein [Aliarcobacter butzleri]MCT7645302.1 DJ-1/PfpI family protein [Aliarcobacter butzleri]MDK2080794.1 DJ-1/PfpI family protein [Aliarcobacter butzleri]MDK2083688.1 DJ-1/PfpI family protein [Aliarcobacter butzleri]
MQKVVGIFVFDDIEVLDFCGPFEVLSVTRLDESKRLESLSPFDVKLVAMTKDVIFTKGNMKIIPDFDFKTCPKLDILIVPGGMGTRKLMYDERVLDFISQKAKEVELLTSVCTGSLILASAKLLDGVNATTHWKSLQRMEDEFKNVKVYKDKHFVEDGNIISSAGISAGIDMALYIVKRYFGENVSRATAKHMEYPYLEENKRRIEI